MVTVRIIMVRIIIIQIITVRFVGGESLPKKFLMIKIMNDNNSLLRNMYMLYH